jgi:hypothetical protein
MDWWFWVGIAIWVTIGVGFFLRVLDHDTRGEAEGCGFLVILFGCIVFWPSILICALAKKLGL